MAAQIEAELGLICTFDEAAKGPEDIKLIIPMKAPNTDENHLT